MRDKLDLVSKLVGDELAVKRFSLNCISPDDGKYGESSRDLNMHLSAVAEWMGCVKVQEMLLETRVEFGQAETKHLEELRKSIALLDPLNMALLESKVTKHDQLAVLEEIGRYVSQETKALLHPGTTAYDILDTARSYLAKKAWKEKVRPAIAESIGKLCRIAEDSTDILQVGRTHLQHTSPVTFGLMISNYASRLAERMEKCDGYVEDLRGKISGIVGTGASIDMVIGEGKSLEFEKAVLGKLGLKPDYTATQVVQKERLADVGHGLTTLMHVLSDFADDIRGLYSSEITEVTSRDNAERLGGSSADATKNNPIDYENIAGTPAVVEGGMRILYEMISSDFQRVLRSSKQGRYQPQLMMVEVYESFNSLSKTLDQLSINEDSLERNLSGVRKNPSEAMVAILRGEGWVHPEYGVGHDFVKEMGKRAQKEQRALLEVSLKDPEFKALYERLPDNKKKVLQGNLENYLGSAKERARINIDYVREVISRG